MKIKINMNSTVDIKLTDYGRILLKEKPIGRCIVKPTTSSTGYTSFSLWELNWYFGEALYPETKQLPFETNIFIEVPEPPFTEKEY